MPTFNFWNIDRDRLKIIQDARLHPDVEEMYNPKNNPASLPDSHGFDLFLPTGVLVKTKVKTIGNENILPDYSMWREHIRKEILIINNKILILNEQDRERGKRNESRFIALERLKRILEIRERRKANERIEREKHDINIKRLVRVSNSSNN